MYDITVKSYISKVQKVCEVYQTNNRILKIQVCLPIGPSSYISKSLLITLLHIHTVLM